MTPAELLNQAINHHKAGRFPEAGELYRQVLALQPNHPDALHLLGLVALNTDPLAAAELIGRATQTHPSAPYFKSLGDAHFAARQFERAAQAYQQAIALKPDFPDALNNLGNTLNSMNRAADAIPYLKKAIELRPGYFHAWNNLGNAFQKSSDLDASLDAYRKAASLKPTDQQIHHNLGELLKRLGHVEESLDEFNRSLNLRPDPVTHSSKIMLLLLHSAYDAKALYRETKQWADLYAVPLRAEIRPHDSDRSTDRRIRIGYVSPDLRRHTVGWNLVPLFARHDHNRFEIFAYSSSPQVDEITHELRQHADAWRDIHNLSDADAADLVRRDRIDILVDLSLHTADNRLLLFARKPAPIAVTYLAYCGTSGMDTIDYRFSDPYMDPPDTDLAFYSEHTIRLPTSYWCYRPAGPAPDINELPLLKNGYVTFGCLNQFSKISPLAFKAWAKILDAIPRSRLIIHHQAASPPRSVIDLLFRSHRDRLEFVPTLPWPQYLQTHQRFDVALDPFPYAGGITTCDSLYMGVPVITLSGQTPVGRGGRSILNNIGLPDLVALNIDQYVQKAIDLANDPHRLIELRGALRHRLQSSPLMDPKHFTKEVEAAFTQMWRRWAGGETC